VECVIAALVLTKRNITYITSIGHYKDSLYVKHVCGSFRVALFKVGHAVAVGMELFIAALVLSVLGKHYSQLLNTRVLQF
jgi:hypothetical protein